MAAPRAYWKGYLKLSLVTCPVALYPASSQSEKTHFHQINRKTGNRLRQQMVDEKTGRVVEAENKARGYELKRGSYVELEPEELEAVEVESTRTIDIDKFVPEEEIDKRYYERCRRISLGTSLGIPISRRTPRTSRRRSRSWATGGLRPPSSTRAPILGGRVEPTTSSCSSSVRP